jgi:hypothetical protein
VRRGVSILLILADFDLFVFQDVVLYRPVSPMMPAHLMDEATALDPRLFLRGRRPWDDGAGRAIDQHHLEA